jgi:ribosomal protein S17E
MKTKKKLVSFTIDEKIYEDFKKITEIMATNKSKFVENKIIEYIKNNQNEIGNI